VACAEYTARNRAPNPTEGVIERRLLAIMSPRRIATFSRAQQAHASACARIATA